MALNKAILKSMIETAFQKAKSAEENPEQAIAVLADDIASAIESYIKAGVVNSTIAGSCSTGPITGTATGTMN